MPRRKKYKPSSCESCGKFCTKVRLIELHIQHIKNRNSILCDECFGSFRRLTQNQQTTKMKGTTN